MFQSGVRRRMSSATMIFCMSIAQSMAADIYKGKGHALDGDTLFIDGMETNIRLFGIDAPEKSQSCTAPDGKPYPCGGAAHQYLAGMLAADDVTCEAKDTDRYGRIVAVCGVGAIEDIGQSIVSNGWALAYRKYSERYVVDEKAARDLSRGLWKGSFEPPDQWRHEN